MPWIIDYQIVLEQMRHGGFKSLYYNSGAFGFTETSNTKTIGWIGPPDASLRVEAAALARPISPPYETNLAHLAATIWHNSIGGKSWIMPMSHWAYELDFGSHDWMPSALEKIGIDAGLLQDRTNGAAIEFSKDETTSFQAFVERLLEMLTTSDFAIAFPGRAALCMIHHHKQLWWTTTDDEIYRALDQAPLVSESR